MPGKNDRDHPLAAQFTEFALLRTVVAPSTDTIATVTELVDFTSSITATHNSLWIHLARTAGAGMASMQVWVFLGGAVNAWVLVETFDSLTDNSLVRLSSIWAGRVKILLTNISTGATWRISEAHSTA